ncbi:sel1 repeat family protein [Citrobacter freundii]|uniref:tetratricopeptide repeat protein n=1 Tax=Citrobacter freundii complex TaxID=1344959 RepID=UPI0015E94AB4|nr:tetratricopeptide repeat protein [Citrobacter freundii]QLR76064.1 sel1 repeat family protein [Citrobacter freundii]
MKKHIFVYLVIFGIIVIFLTMFHGINTNDELTHKDKKVDNLLNCQHVSELEEQAKQGRASALSELGFCYETGQGVDKNYEKSFALYSRSAKQGYGNAQFNIGNAYRHGRGVTQDYQKAIEWYQKAAGQGIIKSQVVLGNMYISGQGVPVDSNKAIKWYVKAAQNNDTAAMNNLGNIYSDGVNIPTDNQRAEDWYLKAVALGSMSARNSLGVFYGRGLGRHPDDRDKALPLVEASACQGYALAQINLGSFYMENDGEVSVDYKKSYAWYYVAYINGARNVKNELNLLTKKMNKEELIDAKKMAAEYSQKYRSSPLENDIYKSQTECKYP